MNYIQQLQKVGLNTNQSRATTLSTNYRTSIAYCSLTSVNTISMRSAIQFSTYRFAAKSKVDKNLLLLVGDQSDPWDSTYVLSPSYKIALDYQQHTLIQIVIYCHLLGAKKTLGPHNFLPSSTDKVVIDYPELGQVACIFSKA